jgi:hypothetical protein
LVAPTVWILNFKDHFEFQVIADDRQRPSWHRPSTMTFTAHRSPLAVVSFLRSIFEIFLAD